MKPQLGQSVFAWALIIASVCLFLFLCSHINFKFSHLTEIFKTTAVKEKALEKITKEIAQKNLNVDQLNPGPPPDWLWNPYSYYVEWKPKYTIYAKAKNELAKLNEDATNYKNELKADVWYQIKSFLEAIWSDLIRPILDIMLLLTALSFGLRVFWRYLLMRGKFGTVRV